MNVATIVFIVSIIIGTSLALSFIFENLFERINKEKESLLPPPYVQYETAESISKKWHDHNLIGLCMECGLSDAPLVIDRRILPESDPEGLIASYRSLRSYMGAPSHVLTKCKWCAELDNITYHLRCNGVRRLKNG